nr:MAG TPA: hypothetical protein [Caudoviricetes sp.]
MKIEDFHLFSSTLAYDRSISIVSLLGSLLKVYKLQ